MTGRALLKNRGLLKRKHLRIRYFPLGVGPDYGLSIAKIGLMVRPEKEQRPFFRRGGDGREKGRLQHPVLVVAPLRPGIRKQDVYSGEARSLRHHAEEVIGLGQDKMKVCEPRPLPLAVGARDPVGGDVDPDATALGMRRGVGREKMSVAASHLPDEQWLLRDDLEKRGPKALAPIGHPGAMLGRPRGPQAEGSPSLPAPIATMRRLMSVGFTPLMRLAWPSVSGLMWVSFAALSRLRPGIFR